jgi:16S rRNA C967 or C1407 C5-methylase (RsmB/RsmF family)
MEPEENDAVIEEFLREPSESRAKVRRTTAGEAVAALSSYLAPGLNPARLFDETGAFRTRPDRDGTDGFFAALLEKGK